jgi:integrase
MSKLFRVKIVEYRTADGKARLADGARVNKNTPGAVRRVTRSKKWYGRYTDKDGVPHKVPLAESKEIARKMLDKLRGDNQLASVGLTDPFEGSKSRPLVEHLDDFGRYLAAAGNCPEYVKNTLAQCRRVIDGCGFERIEDLQPTAVVEFLAALRKGKAIALLAGKETWTVRELAALLGVRGDSVRRMVKRGQVQGEGQGRKLAFTRQAVVDLMNRRQHGVGIETSNHYVGALKMFSRWLVNHKRIGADPLAILSRMNADVDLRHQRRALPPESFSAFIDATAKGKPFRGITGTDRLLLYTLAANTGFRASELASLMPASFDLASKVPTVTVAAGYSKHKRADVQPLRPDVAEMMRQYIAGRPEQQLLWPGMWSEVGAEMVRGDLAAAGIPYADRSGRVFDFHAIRGQFISMLAAGGVHPKVAQALARHSTITLTMKNYSHLDVLDVAGALDKLPGLPQDRKAETRKRA